MKEQAKKLTKILNSLKKEFKTRLKESGRLTAKTCDYSESEKKLRATINALQGIIDYMTDDNPNRRGRHRQEADEFGRITL